MALMKSVSPISDEDLDALPVSDLAGAIDFYRSLFGFAVASQSPTAAVLTRDSIRLGLVLKHDHEAGKAGSLAFEADDLEAMHRELQAKGALPGGFGVDQWGGKRYRTFFVREDTNGYCFCFFTPL
jgi:predicted enzyme related to lactoylglutathione lyase